MVIHIADINNNCHESLYIIEEVPGEERVSTIMKSIRTKQLVIIGMSAAVLAILAQIAIPMPSGMPLTMQTFAVALLGVVLAWKKGLMSTGIYLLLGAIGVPVFANFKGGFQWLINLTGGFLFGFLFLVLFCGIGIQFANKYVGCIFSMIGLALCHLLGVIQFAFISGRTLTETFLLVSFPYLLKDILSVILAFIVGWQVRKRLIKASLL